MINSGRKPSTPARGISAPRDCELPARLTAILGAVVFTVFLTLSLIRTEESANAGKFDPSALPVIAPVSTADDVPDSPAAAEEGSFWYFLESAIARLIYGER